MAGDSIPLQSGIRFPLDTWEFSLVFRCHFEFSKLGCRLKGFPGCLAQPRCLLLSRNMCCSHCRRSLKRISFVIFWTCKPDFLANGLPANGLAVTPEHINEDDDRSSHASSSDWTPQPQIGNTVLDSCDPGAYSVHVLM